MTLRHSLLILCAIACLASSLPSDAAPLPATTRKVVYQKIANGTGYRLAAIEAPVPKPKRGQVLVRMRAIALNRGEIENAAETRGDRSGMIAASDGAGEVVALGPDANEFKIGQRVTSMYWRNWNAGPPKPENLKGALGSSMDGVFGEYVVVDQTALVLIPEGMSFVDASTLPTAALTAWSAVITEGRAGPGKIVLVQGTGGVSTFALQIAHAAGAKVIVTSSSDDKLKRARELGADFTINYQTTPKWGAKVLELTDKHGADVIVEVGGKGTIAQSAECLADLGTIAVIGGVTGYGGEFPAVTLVAKTARAVGIAVGSRAELRNLEAFMQKHRIKPVIDHVYPLSQLETALTQLRTGRFMGKIVVTL
jgi:NADPH:quinone reductase-like Zn-dependent oxidoreductase